MEEQKENSAAKIIKKRVAKPKVSASGQEEKESTPTIPKRTIKKKEKTESIDTPTKEIKHKVNIKKDESTSNLLKIKNSHKFPKHKIVPNILPYHLKIDKESMDMIWKNVTKK
jgi:hypothetical protein